METQLIFKKMSDIFKDVEFIGKNKKNEQQNYKFRGIDDMYNELHNLFAKHDVFLSSKVLKITREERLTKTGGNLIYTILEVEISFFTNDGSSISSVLIGEAMDSADKSANKAMSAALKYALMQTFLIPTEELKDADSITPEPSTPKVSFIANQKKPTNGNEPPKVTTDDNHLVAAIIEMGECKTLEEVKSCWSKWKIYQTDNLFIAEKEKSKQKLTIPTLPL